MEVQLLSQLYNAIIAAIVVIVGGGAVLIVALFKLIPLRINARMEQYKANEATRREIAKEKSDTIRENERADNELKLAMAKTLTEQVPVLQQIVNGLRDVDSSSAAHTIAITNNTQAVAAHGRQITGLTEEVGALREKVEAIGVKISNAVDRLPSNTTEISSSITTLMDISRNITSVQVDLNLLMNKINDVQSRLIQKKHDSKEIPVITKDQLDNPADGTPPAQ